MGNHLGGRFPMVIWIDLVESVCQNSYCLIAVCQGFPMGIDVNSISQSADNQNVVAMTFQVADKTPNEVLSISSNVARSHNTHNLHLVQVAITYII